MTLRCLSMLFVLVLSAPVCAAEFPNIVVILADDLGYGDLGCYNPASKISTPHLDQMAQEGMRFTDAHSGSSVCTPARYSLLTGRYCWRTRMQAGVGWIFESPLIAEDRLTIGKLLQNAGYRTACVGKWHLGWNWPVTDGNRPVVGASKLSNVDFTKPIADGPTTRGFDSYFGVDVPNFPPYCFIRNDRTVGLPTEVSRPEFNHPGPMLPGWQWEEILPELAREASEFIATAAKDQKPFFLYMPLTSPHFPVVPGEDFRGKSGAGDYGDFVAQTDGVVGQVLQALEESGTAENTLIIFSSDNGPEVTGEVDPGVYDRILQYAHSSLGGLRGAKRDLWEGGHRVPFVARWPARVPAGTVNDSLVCHLDLMATAAEIVGAALPENTGEDSFSMLSNLTKDERTRPVREHLVYHSGSGKFGFRSGDWVFIESESGDDNRKAGEPEWFKAARDYQTHQFAGELFNVREDRLQQRNRYADEPEQVQALREALQSVVEQGRSTPGTPQSNDAPIVIRKPPKK